MNFTCIALFSGTLFRNQKKVTAKLWLGISSVLSKQQTPSKISSFLPFFLALTEIDVNHSLSVLPNFQQLFCFLQHLARGLLSSNTFCYFFQTLQSQRWKENTQVCLAALGFFQRDLKLISFVFFSGRSLNMHWHANITQQKRSFLKAKLDESWPTIPCF